MCACQCKNITTANFLVSSFFDVKKKACWEGVYEFFVCYYGKDQDWDFGTLICL